MSPIVLNKDVAGFDSTIPVRRNLLIVTTEHDSVYVFDAGFAGRSVVGDTEPLLVTAVAASINDLVAALLRL